MRQISGDSGNRIVKSICHMCQYGCGIDAHLKDGRLVKVTPMQEHPLNRLCVKSQAIVDWLYSPERITTPLKKTGGSWQRISWDEALGTIGEKLAGIKRDYGARSLFVYYGNAFVDTQGVGKLASRFCSLYGTPNIASGGSLCYVARGIGNGLTVNNRLTVLVPDYDGTKCMLVWGYNPAISNVNEAAKISRARKSGAGLIVIDPRRTELARQADLHLEIRPGTDCALALGLLNVIISEGLYDRNFVERWTVGFEELREHVGGYSPEAVEKLTGIPADKVRQAARMYASSKPATIAQGEALNHCVDGVQTARAVSILVAVTGNLDISGGNIYSPPLRQASFRVKGFVNAAEALGNAYPLYGRFTAMTTAMPLTKALITGQPYPVKALIVQGSNPVLTWPNTGRVRDAFGRLELLVVADLFMTETAEMADIFLPATSFLERDTLHDYASGGEPSLVALGNRAVEPLGECLDDWQIWSELGRKMGYAEYFPWRSMDEVLGSLLEPSGITLEQLRQNPGGVLSAEPVRRQYETQGLGTPSGKVELFSKVMQDCGYDPVPVFKGLPDIEEGNAGSYPFLLTTGARAASFTHSRYRNIKSLRKKTPYPEVEINAVDAGDLGISSGDRVVVESPRGSIELGARVTGDILPGVISLQHGWSEANANILTDDEVHDPVSGYPPFRTVFCRVMKAGK